MKEFLKKANLPEYNVSGVLVDFRASDETVNNLRKLGIDVYFSCKNENLSDSVCGHPDMQIYHIGKNNFISAPECYKYYKSKLKDCNVIKGSKTLSYKYPNDICYNAASCGDFIICNEQYTAAEILNGKVILNVKQGYAKCSTCIISEKATITADKRIYDKCIENNFDCLMIENGDIKLDGMSYGFIGGACGLIGKDKLAVNGEIKTHRNYKEIMEFCSLHNVSIVELKKGEIYDIGSIIPIFYTTKYDKE